MKKILLTAALALSIFFIPGITTNAEETLRMTPDERFDAHIEAMTKRHENIVAEKQAEQDEHLALALEYQAIKLEIVDLYAPEMYELYAEGFTEHNSTHETLFATRMALRDTSFELLVEGMTSVKDDVFAQAEAGEITYKEASEAIQVYKQDQIAYDQSVVEQYLADIEDLVAQNEANKEIAEGLKEDLRAAVEAEDFEAANRLITELYDYLILHIEFDYAKLAIMEAIEF